MKLMTLNAHSLLEKEYIRKLSCFLEYVIREQPDLIALQEVNQSIDASAADPSLTSGMAEIEGVSVPVKTDNHAAWAAYVLNQAGLECRWAWLPVKRGYGRFDEGVAILTLGHEIAETDVQPVSLTDDYGNWKTRKALGVRLASGPDWYYTVHMGWWNDEEEPFLGQWRQLEAQLSVKKASAPVWLLGDFNSPAEIRSEGYDRMLRDGWNDTWLLAGETRGRATVEGKIDGWPAENAEGNPSEGLRIDQIWCSRPVPVKRSHVIFDGRHEPRVSDHCGVMLETGRPAIS